MDTQDDLFFSSATAAPPLPVLVQSQRLTAQQQSFNRLISKIENQTRALGEHVQVADAHRVRAQATLAPLESEIEALNRQMVALLDQRLQLKGWTKAERGTMRDMLCSLAELFAMQGDEEMRALHDRHSGQSLQAKQEAEAQEAVELFGDALGVPLDATQGFESAEEALRAGFARMQQEAQAQHEARQARKGSKKKKSAREQAALQADQDAQTALRGIYRKLAGALHPDREPDAAERERKSRLMADVNAAYDRKDLLALLRLQLQIEQINPADIGQIAQDRLAVLTRLLKDQLQQLEHDLRAQRQQIWDEFDMRPGCTISARSLAEHLKDQQAQLRGAAMQMQRDLQKIEDATAFKRWLKEQRGLMQENGELEMLLDAMARGGMRF